MAKALIDDSTLTGIANAIRAKTGSADTMLPSQMAAAISGISTGTGGGDLALPDTIVAGDTPVMANTSGAAVSATTLTQTNLTLTIAKAGTYRFKICALSTSSAGTVALYKNGTQEWSNAIDTTLAAPVSHDMECNSGDVITVWANKGSASYGMATMRVVSIVACIDWDNGF